MHIVDTARHLARDEARPLGQSVTYASLGISAFVTTDLEPQIVIHAGEDNYRSPGHYFVGLGEAFWIASEAQIRRVVETLAYGFFDYPARECVNKKPRHPSTRHATLRPTQIRPGR